MDCLPVLKAQTPPFNTELQIPRKLIEATASTSPSALFSYTSIESVRAWYRPADGRPREIAQEAYEEARQFLTCELRHGSSFQQVIEHNTSLGDVQSIVESAKHRYSAAVGKRKVVFQWLRKVSERLLYYGTVLDILSQHHPEYTALAWGSVKFILKGIINHEELLVKFSQALVEIGDALRQTRLSASLFQTDAMKDAVGRLYAHILLFFQSALKWYNAHPLERAVRSIVKPYDLEYKETVEQIELCAQNVNDIASAANRAEMRDMHLTIQEMQREMQSRDQKLLEMQHELRQSHCKTDDSVNRILQVAVAHKTVTERVHYDLNNLAPRIYDLQFAQILQFLGRKAPSEELLHKIRSISKRSIISSIAAPDSPQLLQTFTQWAGKEGSSLFVLRVGPRAEFRAKEIAASAIQFLKSQSVHVIWTLSPLIPTDTAPTISSILQGLIYQALRQDQGLLKTSFDELNASKFQSERTEHEWIDLACLIFSRISRYFVVIETQNLFDANRHSPEWAARFLQIFQSILNHAASRGASIKILLLSYHNTISALQANSQGQFTAFVQRPIPVPPRLRRHLRRRTDDDRWRNVSPKF